MNVEFSVGAQGPAHSPLFFCDDRGAAAVISKDQEQKEKVEDIARKVFYDPSFFLQSTEAQKYPISAHMALTNEPGIIFNPAFPTRFYENSSILKTALIASRRLRREALYDRILSLGSEDSFLSLNKTLQSTQTLSQLWQLQVKENPQIFPLLAESLKTEVELVEVALQGDGQNLQYLCADCRSNLRLVKLAMQQFPEAYRFASLEIQYQIR
jgi:hypothetical protein